MINATTLCTNLQNISSQQEQVSYISKAYFLTPVIAIIATFILLVFLLGFLLIKKGWDIYATIFFIVGAVVILLGVFTFYYPLLPQFIPSWFDLFS